MTLIGSAILRKHDVSKWIDMSRHRRVILAVLIALPAVLMSGTGAADETRVIQLKHRNAAELMPMIRPLLGPDDALSGMDYRLILRTSDRNLHDIERLLAQLDVEQRRLRITVQQSVAEDQATASQSVTGETPVGDKGRIILPAEPSDAHGVVIQRNGLRYSANRRMTTSMNGNTQTVLALDGQRAYIRIGQSIPCVQKILALRPNQITLTQGLTLQDITTGFEVLPHVHGDRVRIEITPRLSTLGNPATDLVNFQELTTTVDAKLGEWLDLGAMVGRHDEIQRAILESATTDTGEQRTVRLKIE